MLPPALGKDYMGKRAARYSTGHSRQDIRSTARAPVTPRVRGILETRGEAASKPVEGWIWAAPTRGGHVESSSLKKQHRQVFKTLAEQDQKNNQKSIRRFVLYSLRHTFLTRLGESGRDVWTLARIAGQSDIRMSARYVHPSEDAVLGAMARLGGHKIGHNQTDSGTAAHRQLTQ
jgi:integrase